MSGKLQTFGLLLTYLKHSMEKNVTISSFHIDTRLLDVSMCSSNLKVCGNNNCLTEYSKSGGNWGPDDDCCTRFSDDMTFI